ncbi:Flp pilus assembly protein CpaB [Lederbergia panacisoli]|uniref:Flp pilus assembly protein CpaB n=1 Tax=Lederbergia panacisoli TaxID=1255251 RepID=UPI00214AF311|nr:Flp pilus assembly protein CpaB [Lederbergia panacisoli]MCR2823185.1 Flp pilus assembly protein CpaB [Lederbergia panacisoli]
MRSRTLFLLAILMGLITTMLFVFSMKNEQPAASETIEMADVVVAISPIKIDQVITDEMIELREIPLDQKHVSAVKNKEDVIGKLAAAKIEPDEVILLHRLQTKEEQSASLSKKVTDGLRGVSIGLNIVQSITNLVEPEDYVDVIHTVKKKKGTEEIVITKQILSNVRVLAIGQKLTITSDNNEIIEFGEVTLELSPEDSVKIVNAHETGSLHLAIHSRIQK